jgi:hypothetical protein
LGQKKLPTILSRWRTDGPSVRGHVGLCFSFRIYSAHDDATRLQIVFENLRHWESDRDLALPKEIADDTKGLLGFVSQKAYLLFIKLMLRGGGTFSPLRCRCRRSS